MLKRNLKSPARDWVLKCNCCRTEHTFAGAIQFDSIITWLREKGWKARTHSQIWEHLCPDCKASQLDDRYLKRLHA